MPERLPDQRNDGTDDPPRRTGKVRWESARPGLSHAIAVGPKGLEALRRLGRRLAEKKAP